MPEWSNTFSDNVKLTKQGAVTNPKKSQPEYTAGGAFVQCLFSFVAVIGIEAAETIIQLIAILKTWLELQ